MTMASAGPRTLQQDLEAIFRAGTLSALSDGQLLARFLEGRDRTGEQAFEAIVNRHGPMVYRVCCQVLGDGHEAQDAFQAVFLVLARRASSVRNRESLGSWLYGVALRVSARSRAGLRRRQSRELQSESDLNDLEAPGQVAGGSGCETAGLIHQEIGRLPEKHRAPIVLCYLEGLTHDQAAARLNWPVGTVAQSTGAGPRPAPGAPCPPGSDGSCNAWPPGRLADGRLSDHRRSGLDRIAGSLAGPRPDAGDHRSFRMPVRTGKIGSGSLLGEFSLTDERGSEIHGT